MPFGEVTLFSLHGIVDLRAFSLLKGITYGLATMHTFLKNAGVFTGRYIVLFSKEPFPDRHLSSTAEYSHKAYFSLETV